MLRGINRQVIFEDDGDRRYFISVLGECKKVSGFKLHAFCLMANHVHLLIEPAEESLEIIFKRIGSRYATWYNRKYQRVGHLFQDRFRSENVETDSYYLTVLRYILQNPMKAGMESRPGSYRWSSYLAYEQGSGSLTDTEYAKKFFTGREALISFLRESNDDQAMDEPKYQWRLSDEEAAAVMHRVTGCPSVSTFQQLDSAVRKEYARRMYLEKMSMEQIARLAGMSKTTVMNAIKAIDSGALADRQTISLREPGCYDFGQEEPEIW